MAFPGLLVLLTLQTGSRGQSSAPTTLAFDVVSVRQNTSAGDPDTNVPLTRGDFYPPNGGVLKVRAMPLINLLNFAYKLTEFQKQELLAHAPGWIATDRFNVEARSERQPSKDEMRQMVQRLLSDRFALSVHEETREVPVLVMMLVKPGVTGPQLTPHATGDPACTKPDSHCGAFGAVPASVKGRRRIVGQDVRLQMFADEMAGLGHLGRPVLDRTGLRGTFDFQLEFLPERAPGAAASDDAAGATFLEALREQLGVKLEPARAPQTFTLVDHVEHPSAN